MGFYVDCYFFFKCYLKKKLCFIAPFFKKSIMYHSLDASFIDSFLFVHLFIQKLFIKATFLARVCVKYG